MSKPIMSPATKPVDELDDKLHQILDDFYDEPFIDALPIAKKQIEALLTEARIDELEQLPLDGLQDQCFIDLRKRIDKRLAQLKNERSNK